MNKKILVIAVAAIALLSVVLVLASKKNEGSENMANDSTTQSDTSSLKSLKELVASNKPTQCNFNISESSKGSVYIASGKVRGDFSVSIADKVTTAHMIGDGTTSYVWMDGQTTGFKMAYDPKDITEEQKMSATEGLDLEKKMDYKCSDWTVDSTLFNVPSGVKFSELNIPKVDTSVRGGVNTDMKVQQCSACDSAPESVRAQCKTALGCN